MADMKEVYNNFMIINLYIGKILMDAKIAFNFTKSHTIPYKQCVMYLDE